MRGLRILLILDSAILFWLGAAFIAAPGPVARMFGFFSVDAKLEYVLAMWGCVFITMAGGYAITATNPLRNIAWIQVGIARGVLEAAVGAWLALRGVVSWSQASFGIAVGAFIALAYIALYPRKGPAIEPAGAAKDG